jgi:hypothetical protein
MPKTGTTVVQNCLAIYAREDGELIDYTLIGRDNLVAHHPLAQALRTDGSAGPLFVSLFDRLREPDNRPVLVSSESFSNLVGPRLLTVLLNFILECRAYDRVCCVLAIREITSFQESMYLQSTRFGNATSSIDNYIAARMKVVGNFFAGVGKLRSQLGDDFRCPMVTEGFDSVSEIESAAGVEANTLGKYRARIPDTTKRSLKAQTALLYLNEIEQRTGLPLARRKLLSALKRGVRFDDDTFTYTIISNKLAGELSHLGLKAAAEIELRDYLDAFGGGGERPPYCPLDIERLTPRDIDLVVSLARSEAKATTAS